MIVSNREQEQGRNFGIKKGAKVSLVKGLWIKGVDDNANIMKNVATWWHLIYTGRKTVTRKQLNQDNNNYQNSSLT